MRLLHLTLAAFSVALLTSDAQADTLTGSYSGFVSATPVFGRQYFDLGNIFGLGVNPDVGGHRISGTFTYNPAGATTQACSPGGASECTNYFGVADTITAKIEGHTISETGVQLAELSLGANLPGSGTEFSLIAVNSFLDIAVLVRTFSDQFAAIPDLAQHGDAVAAVRFRVRDRQRCEQFAHRFPPAARYLGARLLPHHGECELQCEFAGTAGRQSSRDFRVMWHSSNRLLSLGKVLCVFMEFA